MGREKKNPGPSPQRGKQRKKTVTASLISFDAAYSFMREIGVACFTAFYR